MQLPQSSYDTYRLNQPGGVYQGPNAYGHQSNNQGAADLISDFERQTVRDRSLANNLRGDNSMQLDDSR